MSSLLAQLDQAPGGGDPTTRRAWFDALDTSLTAEPAGPLPAVA